jgi:hypothetical protein
MSFSTPIGFLIFNRPDVTEKVFNAIAQIKPKQLFVIADGARPDRLGEAEKCEQTRSIIQKIDWDCDLKTNFSDVNLGCGRRESSGFDWIFSQVEEAIFLEDDTLPSPYFFSFCEALLERYRDDERVMHINGDNSLCQIRNPYSYYFSKYMHGWGWASWRRAWKYYDYSMKTWPNFWEAGLLNLVCESQSEKRYWERLFNQMYKDPQIIDTWDPQWMYSIWSQNGLVIAPNGNLISNLGFNRADAAHTTGNDPTRANLSFTDIQDMQHPPFIVRDRAADYRSFKHIYAVEVDPIMKIRRRLSVLQKTFNF